MKIVKHANNSKECQDVFDCIEDVIKFCRDRGYSKETGIASFVALIVCDAKANGASLDDIIKVMKLAWELYKGD